MPFVDWRHTNMAWVTSELQPTGTVATRRADQLRCCGADVLRVVMENSEYNWCGPSHGEVLALSLSIYVQPPTKGRGGCSRVPAPPTAKWGLAMRQFKNMFMTPLYQQHASHTLASRAYGPQPHMRSSPCGRSLLKL